MIEIPSMMTVVRAVFHENNKYYPQVFLDECLYKLWIIIKMLYFDRIEVSEGINVNKTSKSKESNIFHYWYFLCKGFKFQPYVCNRCHERYCYFKN